MASKYNTSVSGCTGQVVIGDNAKVSIVRRQVASTSIKDEQPSTIQVESGFPLQETTEHEIPSVTLKKGYVLIINNQEFPSRSDVERKGSAEDVKQLYQLFDDFGMTVKTIQNKTSLEMLELLEETSEKDFTKFDCFICIILSHGSHSGIYGVDEKAVQVESLTNKFRGSTCPSLQGKPKVFFLQACRGAKKELVAVESDSEPVPIRHSGLPSDSDFLICYASSPGYESYRNPELGSWFIRSIVDVFRNFGETEHLMDLMLRVNHRVASLNSNLGHKQMPSEVCMLTRKVYFNAP